MKKRYWHIGICAVLAAAIFSVADFLYLGYAGALPDLKTIWWLTVPIPMVCGAVVTLGCGGAAMWRRIVGAAVCGVLAGFLYTAASAIIGQGMDITAGEILAKCAWRVFIFSMISPLGAMIAEVKMKDPDL